MNNEFELDEKRKKSPSPSPLIAGGLASPSASRQVNPPSLGSKVRDLQRSAGNKATTELIESIHNEASKAKEPASGMKEERATGTSEFQPGSMRSAELDSIMRALESMRARGRAQEFSDFLSQNEILLYPILKRYGYRGSWIKSEDMIKDFEQAYRKWVEFPEERGYAVDSPLKPAKPPDPWQNVWQVAGSDPLAALWISATVMVSETL